PHSRVEIGIKHGHSCDLVNRKLVTSGGLPDRLWTRRVIDAERSRLVLAHKRADPRHALFRVPLDDPAAALRSTVCHRSLQTLREGALHHVSRQIVPPVRFARHATNLRATAIDRIGRTAYIGTTRHLSWAPRTRPRQLLRGQCDNQAPRL